MAFEVNSIISYIEKCIITDEELTKLLSVFDEKSLMILSDAIKNRMSETEILLLDDVIDKILLNNYENLKSNYFLSEDEVEKIDMIFLKFHKRNMSVIKLADLINTLTKKEIILLLNIVNYKGDRELYDKIILADDINNKEMVISFMEDVDNEDYLAINENYNYTEALIVLNLLNEIFDRIESKYIVAVNNLILKFYRNKEEYIKYAIDECLYATRDLIKEQNKKSVIYIARTKKL